MTSKRSGSSWPTNSPHNCSHPLCPEPRLKRKDQLQKGDK
jgi:hypothetical protein